MLLDLRLNEKDVDDREGQRLLHEIHLLSPDIPVLMITAHGDISTAVECMRLGAVDFLEKSYVSLPEIKARLEHAVQQGLISRRLIQLEQDFHLIEPRDIVGKDQAIIDIKRMVAAVAEDCIVTVLLSGESGTGKELIARAIHANGRRRNNPFVPVMLNALPSRCWKPSYSGMSPWHLPMRNIVMSVISKNSWGRPFPR